MVFEGKTERGVCRGIEINDRKTRHDDVYIFLIMRLGELQHYYLRFYSLCSLYFLRRVMSAMIKFNRITYDSYTFNVAQVRKYLSVSSFRSGYILKYKSQNKRVTKLFI